jgi:hypothetical protein
VALGLTQYLRRADRIANGAQLLEIGLEHIPIAWNQRL